jgi:hypothetical protein
VIIVHSAAQLYIAAGDFGSDATLLAGVNLLQLSMDILRELSVAQLLLRGHDCNSISWIE